MLPLSVERTDSSLFRSIELRKSIFCIFVKNSVRMDFCNGIVSHTNFSLLRMVCSRTWWFACQVLDTPCLWSEHRMHGQLCFWCLDFVLTGSGDVITYGPTSIYFGRECSIRGTRTRESSLCCVVSTWTRLLIRRNHLSCLLNNITFFTNVSFKLGDMCSYASICIGALWFPGTHTSKRARIVLPGSRENVFEALAKTIWFWNEPNTVSESRHRATYICWSNKAREFIVRAGSRQCVLCSKCVNSGFVVQSLMVSTSASLKRWVRLQKALGPPAVSFSVVSILEGMEQII